MGKFKQCTYCWGDGKIDADYCPLCDGIGLVLCQKKKEEKEEK